MTKTKGGQDTMQRPARVCSLCPRLVKYRRDNRKTYPDYWNAPVFPWGETDAPLLIVGLAPGVHGANRTGLPFTGDASGDLLLPALCEVKLACDRSGEIELQNCRITNAVACVPPQNAPVAAEVSNCAPKLNATINPKTKVIVTLGGTAHRATLKVLGAAPRDLKFAHGAAGKIGERQIFASYHPSRYNVNTGRITRDMLLDVLRSAVRALA